MVFSPAISALQSSFGAGKALSAAQVKVNEEEGVDADKSLDTCKRPNETLWRIEPRKSSEMEMHLNALWKKVSMASHFPTG